MGFLINNTTPMTFNRVYRAPIALDSASGELALKPSLYNYKSTHYHIHTHGECLLGIST